MALRGRLRRDGANRRDDGSAEQVGRLFCAMDLDEVADSRRARERHDIESPLEEHLVDVQFAVTTRLDHDGPVGDDLGDFGPLLPQFVADHLPTDVGVGQQHPQAANLPHVRHRRDDRFGPVFTGRQVHLQAMAGQSLGGRGSDRAEA